MKTDEILGKLPAKHVRLTMAPSESDVKTKKKKKVIDHEVEPRSRRRAQLEQSFAFFPVRAAKVHLNITLGG